MKTIYLAIALFITLLTSACTPLAPVAETSADSAAAPETHALTITVNANGWHAPESVPAGWTDVTLVNQSEGMRQTAFLRLDDGKTMDDVFAAIEAGMAGPAEWMTALGGVSGVMPGETKNVTIDLPAGQYIVIDPVPEADGLPGMAKGYFLPLTVEASDIATAPPEQNMALELVDYSFLLDTDAIRAGTTTFRISNKGPMEAHEVVFIKLDEGTTTQNFLEAMFAENPAGPPPGQIVAGTAAFDIGVENYVDVEFESGETYGLICFTPSTLHGGQPHFMQGMVGQFTVP